MVLVDTSVWISHYRRPDDRLLSILARSLIYSHPVVMGELALGGLPDGQTMLSNFSDLRPATIASHEDTLMLITGRHLSQTGIGYADAQILASILLTPDAVLWTHDQRLDAVAERMGVSIPADL